MIKHTKNDGFDCFDNCDGQITMRIRKYKVSFESTTMQQNRKHVHTDQNQSSDEIHYHRKTTITLCVSHNTSRGIEQKQIL